MDEKGGDAAYRLAGANAEARLGRRQATKPGFPTKSDDFVGWQTGGKSSPSL